MSAGNKQDALILGEVISVQDDEAQLKIIHVFPQTKIDLSDTISVKHVAEFYEWYYPSGYIARTIAPGKKYFVSLNKEEDGSFVTAWGIFEVTGTSYSDAKLLEITHPDQVAVQLLINSGGKATDFSYDGNTNTMYARQDKDTIEYEIYPTYTYPEVAQPTSEKTAVFPWIVGIALLIGSVLLFQAKRRT